MKHTREPIDLDSDNSVANSIAYIATGIIIMVSIAYIILFGLF